MTQTLPRRIENPVTGDVIDFIASPLMGDGETLIFRSSLPGYAAGAPMHSHADMLEIFEVEYGALEIDLVGGDIRLLGPGERIEISPGTEHGFRNPLDTETRFLNISTPGIELEKFLRAMFGLAAEGRTNAAGMPTDPRAMAVAMGQSDMRFAGAPQGLQRILIAALAAAARWTGIERGVTRHWSPASGART